MLSIVCADGHGLHRKGLRVALQAAFPAVEFVESDTLDTLLSVLERPQPADLVLIDLNIPGLTTIDVVRAVHEQYPRTRFVILSAAASRANVLAALAAGLHGFISKAQSEDEIVTAVSDVLSGRIYVPPGLAQVPVNGPEEEDRVAEAALGADRQIEFDKLTPRQRDVLVLIAQGLSNKEIARKLEIAEPTTKIHVAGLLRTLGVRNRTEAAVVLRKCLEHS